MPARPPRARGTLLGITPARTLAANPAPAGMNRAGAAVPQHAASVSETAPASSQRRLCPPPKPKTAQRPRPAVPRPSVPRPSVPRPKVNHDDANQDDEKKNEAKREGNENLGPPPVAPEALREAAAEAAKPEPQPNDAVITPAKPEPNATAIALDVELEDDTVAAAVTAANAEPNANVAGAMGAVQPSPNWAQAIAPARQHPEVGSIELEGFTAHQAMPPKAASEPAQGTDLEPPSEPSEVTRSAYEVPYSHAAPSPSPSTRALGRERKRIWRWLGLAAVVVGAAGAGYLGWQNLGKRATSTATASNSPARAESAQHAPASSPKAAQTDTETPKKASTTNPSSPPAAGTQAQNDAEAKAKNEKAGSPASSEATESTELVLAEGEILPEDVNGSAVFHLVERAVRRAQKCHPGGRTTGTAQLFITFAPDGTVSGARLAGEPLASAPVAQCVLAHAQAVRTARFSGSPFTVQTEITLR